MIVDPQRITKFDRTTPELEAFWLFCLMVAGKNARSMALAVERLLKPAVMTFPAGTEPPDRVWRVRPRVWLRMLDEAGVLRQAMKEARTGKYRVLETAIRESYLLGLTTATVAELMQIHGVGPKTARYFVMHSRPNQRIAALDTHILAWLRDQGHDAPPTTPTNPAKYAALEAVFLEACDARGKSPAAFDLEIWNSRSKSGTGVTLTVGGTDA